MRILWTLANAVPYRAPVVSRYRTRGYENRAWRAVWHGPCYTKGAHEVTIEPRVGFFDSIVKPEQK